MAQIFNRAATSDNILILGTRESATQPFNAPGWTDLRVGFFVSLTQAGAVNDTPTGLGETFAASVPPTNPADYFYIGIKDSGPNLPRGPAPNSYIGWSNSVFSGTPNVQLLTSDLAVGSSAYYWRAINSVTGRTFMFVDNNLLSLTPDIGATSGLQSHFYQSADPGNSAPAGYYCGMLAFRLTRANPSTNSVTIQIPSPVDMFWTNAPTSDNLIAKLDPFPAGGSVGGPITFSVLPSALFCYWPFHLSRLRISAWGILRSA